MMESEMEMRCLQAKECQGLLSVMDMQIRNKASLENKRRNPLTLSFSYFRKLLNINCFSISSKCM